jgi:hypothetical protein
LEAAIRRSNNLHFHCHARSTWSVFRERCSSFTPSFSKSLVPILVFSLEVQISRWSRPAKDDDPVLDNTALGEWPVTIFLQKFVGVEILSRSLTATHQEEMIAHQCCRIRSGKSSINDHREGNPEVVYRSAERDTL